MINLFRVIVRACLCVWTLSEIIIKMPGGYVNRVIFLEGSSMSSWKKSVNLIDNRRSCRVWSWRFMAVFRQEWTKNDAFCLLFFLSSSNFLIIFSLAPGSMNFLEQSWDCLLLFFYFYTYFFLSLIISDIRKIQQNILLSISLSP